MRLSSICWRIAFALVGPALISTFLLYLYPAILGCSFPSPPRTASHNDSSFSGSGTAPFRLLVLADPQLEGDTSLPDPDAPLFPSVQHFLSNLNDSSSTLVDIHTVLTKLVIHDIPSLLSSARKRVDLIGNDYYLAHIYRTLYWYTQPSHVTVLGDLLGSQWLPDEEFENRGWRYWTRVFRHAQRVEDEITNVIPGGHQEVLGSDEKWSRRVINIAGNHDVGYAGDLSEQRIERFERTFGRANWDVTFTLPAPVARGNETAITQMFTKDNLDRMSCPSIRLLILNSMNLDGPALSSTLQQETYTHINDQFIARASPVEESSTFTLLLTHIPLHKSKGVCVDAPYFSYFSPPHHAKITNFEKKESNAIIELENGSNEYLSLIHI